MWTSVRAIILAGLSVCRRGLSWLGRLPALLSLLRTPLARRRFLILFAAAIVCSYAAGVLWYVRAVPDIGLRCAFTPVVLDVDPEFLDLRGQSEKREELAASLKGKTIVEVAGHKVSTWPQMLRVLADLHPEEDAGEGIRHCEREEGGECVRLRLVQGAPAAHGSLFSRSFDAPPPLPEGHDPPVWVHLGKLPLSALVPAVLWFCLKAGLFAVGALVFWKRPDDPSARQFFVLSIVTFGAFMGGYHWSRIITQPVLLLIFMTSAMLLPAVSLHFYLVFPRPKAFLQKHPRRTLLAVYSLPVVFLVLILSGYLRVRWLFREGLGHDTGGAQRFLLQEILYEVYIYFGVAALLYLASAVCLVHSYRTAASPPERNQVKWILYGVLASLVPIGYSLYLALFNPDAFGTGGVTWPMFAGSACITVAFTVSITRYRLMQLDQILSSSAVYFLLSLAAGIAYYAVLFLGTLLFSHWFAVPSLQQAVGVSAAALVLLLVLDWLRGRVKRRLDRYFHREKSQLDRTLRRMSQAVERLVDPPTLAGRMLRETAELLAIGHGAVYLREGEPARYRLADHLGPAPALTELPPGCPVVEALLPARSQTQARSASEGNHKQARSASEGTEGFSQGFSQGFSRGFSRGFSQGFSERFSREGQESGTLTGAVIALAERAATEIGHDNLSLSGNDAALRQLRFLGGPAGFEVVCGLMHEGQMLALLLLGAKQRDAYSPEDLNLLAAFAQVTVLALVSTAGHRLIEKLNQELQAKVEKIAEQQRRILALQAAVGTRSQESGVRSQEATDRAVAASKSLSSLTPDSCLLTPGAGGMVGSSPQVRELLELVRKVSDSQATVLIRGETGTGKELLARALHETSPRARKQFVAVHCAGLAPQLIESELFGHVKGAYTNAHRDRVGRFEQADGGTLFLDEIGDVSLEVQTKLLRVLQEMTFERVGSSEPIRVDVRLIAATHRDLEQLIRDGRFREDLYYRLNVIALRLPPLRERREDVAELAQHFLKLFAGHYNRDVQQLDDDALAALKAYPWPGNIRELENALHAAVVKAAGPVVRPEDLPPTVVAGAELEPGAAQADGEGAVELPLGLQAERAQRNRREREQLVHALAATGGNKAEAARYLGLARSTFLSRLKKHGLS
jgi:transcriptional regulator with GAF, ATPase, and Fis domain